MSVPVGSHAAGLRDDLEHGHRLCELHRAGPVDLSENERPAPAQAVDQDRYGQVVELVPVRVFIASFSSSMVLFAAFTGFRRGR